MDREGRLEARALRMVWRGIFSTESGWTGLRRALKEAAGVLRKAGDGIFVRDDVEEEGGGGEDGELKCRAGAFEREEAGRSDETVPAAAALVGDEDEDDRTKDAPPAVVGDGDMVEV